MQRPDPVILIDRRLKLWHELDSLRRPWCDNPSGVFGRVSDLDERFNRCVPCALALQRVGVKVG